MLQTKNKYQLTTLDIN